MVWTVGLDRLTRPLIKRFKKGLYLVCTHIWKLVSRIVLKMAKSPQTWCFVVAFIFTLLAMKPSGFSSSRNVDPIPMPQRVFQKGSPVLEFSDGNMVAVEELLKFREVDFVMVMFYAHWDGTSLSAAQEFENVARKMVCKDVKFFAVNCWWPYGVCARQRVLNYYPMFTLIHQTLGELEYTGLLKEKSMTMFLQRVINPFTFIEDKQSLKLFSAEHDVSVIAYFNFLPSLNGTLQEPSGFVSFFKASVRAVVKDPINPIVFGIITNNQVARSLSMIRSQDTQLRRMLNVSLVYPRHLPYNSKMIVSWAYKHQQKAVKWLVPTLRKSLIFSSLFSKGPTLLFFTPHQEETMFGNNFHLLRTVALDYWNCKNSSNIWDAIQMIHSERQKMLEERNLNGSLDLECCSTLSNNQRIQYLSHYNTCEVCEHSSQHQAIQTNNCKVNSAIFSKSLEFFGTRIFSGPSLCLNWLNNYNPFSEIRVCCKKVDLIGRNRYSQSIHACSCNGGMNTEAIFNPNSKEKFIDNIYRKQSYSDAHRWSEFTGLGCKTNKTLDFYAIRSDMFWSIAEHLGLRKSKDDISTSAVIIDKQYEMQHVLQPTTTLSVDSLQNFILKFTNDDLQRFLRSSAVPDVGVPHQGVSSNVFIQEVTTETFHQIVLNNTQDVMLLYYAPWCGLCFRIFHLYLSFAKLLQNVGLHEVLVSRIDGDANDLPWQFSVSTYPTIIFFPVGQANNSVKLPEKEQITVLSLVKFTLKHTTQSI
ncbi:thioredoxin domain-containing protein 11-like [Antedon mediterranea]|uniref:thioredoxin domain-containing protein 11-like n=1 Tax=Antedon mediterranea TaxID=105859 RepID=UPI003AF4BBA4